MLIPVEKINEAKALYDGQAIKEIFEHFGYEYDGKMKGILCPFHDDKNASFIWNPKANAAHCFGCNRNYDIIDLYLDQGMTFLEAVQKLFKNVGMEYSFDERGKQNKPTYKYPKREIGYDRTKVETYLGKRKISPKTLDYADVQADENGNIVFHYYDANDVLLNTKYRPSRKIEPGENKCWFQPGSSTTPILYNMNRIDPSKPLVITEGECFKGDTEVLTPKGWTRLDQYNNEKVVQINQDLTGEFVLPISYIKKDYDGDMYYLSKGRNYSLEVTAGHNIVYVDKKGNIIKKAAKDMPKSIGSGFLPTTTTIDGNGINLSKEQIALYIAISADCTIDIRKTTRHSRFAVKKERKYLRLKGLLNALNISYFDNSNASNGYYYIGFKTPEWIKSKMFPVEWLEQATLEQRRFILDEMVYWDGNRVPNRSQVEYSSKIYEQAVWMQTMAHTCGYMSTIMKRSNKYGEWYKVSILFNKNSVSFQHGFDSIQNYKGKVYCVTVPTGMILIRHQGHISICGNCDTLSIIEAGYTNAVSVPTGAQATTWITECWDWLEQFQKIIIWSDNDSAGIKMRNECVRRLGSWRTFFVEIKDEDLRSDKKICKDANEVLYFYGKDRVLEYINNPIDTPIEGVIDLAEAEDFDMESAEGLYTGIEDLDKQIYKLVFGTVTLITGKAGCVDCDTEFFDGKCWKKISEYKLGDKVLQYNANGSAELVEPLQYHKYEANNLWHIETKYGIDMCVSDEHNMFYITSKNNLYSVPFSRFKQVHDRSVNGHPGRFITSFNYNGKGIDLTDDELKLMLAVICDGSFSNRNKGKFCRINIKKERKKIELENILKATGIKYTRRNREDGFSCFYFRAPIRTKQFTEEWYDCTQHQLNLIAENIYKWDGTQYDDSFEFFTTDKINANFIQFAYSACGYRASLRIDDRRGRVRTINGKNYITRSIDYNVYATHRNLVSIARKDGAKTPIVPYKTLDGYKYCFTVPSHMWIMRRNGSICITGNSGKSVFANQIGIAEALNQGYNCFVYSGELPAPVLRNWVETNLIGRENITMKNEVVRILNPTARQQLKEWYKGRVVLYDDSLGVTSKSLLEKMEEAVRKLGCRVITIDNLMCIDLMCSENDRLEAEKTFVKDLVLFAKKFNVLIFLLAHPRKSLAGETSLNLQSISGASAIGNLCHMAFAIHRYTNKEKEGETNMRGEYIKGCEPKTYDTYIEVIKNRLTGLMPKIEVYFDFPSYRFYRTPAEVWKKYKWNKDLKPVSDTDPNSHTIVKESPLND